MFQHALIACLKWISGVSLPFRLSSGARAHLTWVTTTLVAAQGQRAWIPWWGLKWKEQPLCSWQRDEPPQKLQAVVDFISSTLLRSHREQHISGQPVAKAWDRVPDDPPPRCPAVLLPSAQPWSTITTRHLAFDWRKKHCLLFEGINGEIITFLIRLKDSFSILGIATSGVQDYSLRRVKKNSANPPGLIASFSCTDILKCCAAVKLINNNNNNKSLHKQGNVPK